MTLQEKLLYQLAGELSKARVPVVVKGALVTKLILIENNYDMPRRTRDIDMNWIKEPLPSMEELVELINTSLGKIQNELDLYAIPHRKYIPEVQSAGINILDKNTGVKVFSVDINTGFLGKSKLYNYENAKFQGVLPSEILADKICILSGDRIFRRAKDIMDIYALSQCVDIQMVEILDVCEEKGRKMGSFDNFCNRKADLEHAYDKLVGIENKPPFADVYTRLSNFILPFVEKGKLNQFWDHKRQTWHELDVPKNSN